jgi:hypothetical protein
MDQAPQKSWDCHAQVYEEDVNIQKEAEEDQVQQQSWCNHTQEHGEKEGAVEDQGQQQGWDHAQEEVNIQHHNSWPQNDAQNHFLGLTSLDLKL